MAIKHQEAIEPAFVERPIPHRSGIDVDKAGMRIPPHAAALHCAGLCHRLGEIRVDTYVERAADDMLAVLGNSERGAGEHRVGFGCAISRQDRGFGLAYRIQNIGQEIDDPDIDLRLFAGMVVAQENTKLVNDPRDRALVVAVRPIEGLAGMAVDEAQPAQGHWRTGNRARHRRPRCGKSGHQG